jgi:hypothetical protein
MFSNLAPRVSAPRVSTALGLSPRERQIRAGMADGLTNKAIAARLGLSAHTTDDYARDPRKAQRQHPRRRRGKGDARPADLKQSPRPDVSHWDRIDLEGCFRGDEENRRYRERHHRFIQNGEIP